MKAKMSMSFKKSMSFKRFFSRCVKAFLAIVIGSAFLSVSSRAGEKETRAIDELSYAEIMISAVTVDMAAYIDCVPEDMAVARGVALKAIADLDEIKRFVGGISADGELSALKKMNLDISDMLISAYSMIGIGDQARVAEKMDEVIIKCEHYAETAGPVYEKYNLITDSSDLSPYEAEKKLIESVEDSETYLEALKYCDEEKYPEAGELLRKLLDKYTDKSFGDCIKLQISNCLILGNINSKTADRAAGLEEGIGLLTEILDSGKYSPVLYEAFFRWRTLEQYYKYGLSDRSEIPNKLYNNKRWQLVSVIRAYLASHGSDKWAEAQIRMLLSLPNIKRGAETGNDNVMYWKALFSNET